MDCDKFSAIDLMVDVYYKITEMISVYFLLKNQILQPLFNFLKKKTYRVCHLTRDALYSHYLTK